MIHICHLSVLNPLKHSRIFNRWGLCAKQLGCRVSILAQGERSQGEDSGIMLYGNGNFSRLSLRRLFFSFSQRKRVLEMEADIYVLHSPELLGLGRWLKRKSKAKIVYDAHEDYAKNILHATHYPAFLKKPLAAWTRKQEVKALDYLDALVYAEDCYEGMLPVEKKRRYVFRNKFSPPSPVKGKPLVDVSQPYMLTTGTLAWPWGIRESFDLWRVLCRQRPLRWIVAGHGYNESVLKFLEKEVPQSEFGEYFTLIGGRSYVEHGQIVELIRNCLFGTALYHLLPQIRGKIPTKFYEFAALGRPLLFPADKAWETLNGEYPFGFAVEKGAWEDDTWIRNLWEKLKSWEPSSRTQAYAGINSELPSLKSLIQALDH